MPAPPLTIAEWVKGTAIELKPGAQTNLLVVEFWATWCHPCVSSIPALTALQKRYRDQGVIVVGISDEPVGIVKPFVEGMGQKMDYRVAVDQDRQTASAYLGASGASELPHSFLIDRSGVVVWHGNPMNGLEHILEQVIAGTYDLEAVKRTLDAPKLMEEYFDLVAPDQLSPKAAELGNRIVTAARANPSLLNDFAWTILTERRVTHRDLALAVRASQTAVEATHRKEAGFLDTYARALFDTGKTAPAIAVEQEAIDVCIDSKLKSELIATLVEYRKRSGK
jgi:thiol-disulfide isomerase/thioredoxin